MNYALKEKKHREGFERAEITLEHDEIGGCDYQGR